MSLLILIAALWCFGLLLLDGLLGVATQRFPGRQRVAAYHEGGAMADVPRALFLHPRMDSAAGYAPLHQAVNLDQQRSRHELSESPGQPPATAPAFPAAFQPFEQRQRQSRSFRQRLDRVYARDTMGDLSDPVCRKRMAA